MSPAWCTSRSPRTSSGAKPKALGAAVAPEKIGPAIPAPADFDAFWAAKITALRKVPAKPRAHREAQRERRRRLRHPQDEHVEGKHVWGQVAKPHDATNKKKYPGLVILQWASPPYPLQKSWVTDRAAEGWLAVNIEPHDVMPDQPKAYYDALPQELKNYNSIETRNRDKNYFLYMYLADIRAVDYLASRPDWDGKTLVVMGTSMGGQQSLCAAGLHPKVTHMLVNVPAGADANGTAHGRKIGYPFWDVNDPQVLKTAEYFDTVNCAARIKVPSLVSMGFIDTVTPPVGIWAAFNPIKGPKEAAPMLESPHNHLATPEQSLPWTQRVGRLARRAGRGPLADRTAPMSPRPRTDANSKLAHEQLLAKRNGRVRSTSTSWAIRSRAAGARPTSSTRTCSRTGAQNFHGWNAANFGWGADKTQHMSVAPAERRTRRRESENRRAAWPALTTSAAPPRSATPSSAPPRWRAGSPRSSGKSGKRAPKATLVITGITPRNDNIAVMPVINRRQPGHRQARGWQIGTLRKHQRTTGRSPTGCCVRHGPRRAASHAEGVPGLGRRPETDLHRKFSARRPPRIARRRRRAIRARTGSAKGPLTHRKVRDLTARSAQDRPAGRVSEVSGVHARVRQCVSRCSARHRSGVGDALDRVSSHTATSPPRFGISAAVHLLLLLGIGSADV